MKPLPTSVRAGFTLIEMLAVILILTLLMGFLVVQFAGLREGVEEDLTKSRLQMLRTAADAYENERGDFPLSSFLPEQGAVNGTNLGGEALVVALFSRRFEGGGTGFDEDTFVNTDEDTSTARLTDFDNSQLFEFSDQWDNPVAYFNRHDYGRADLYLTQDPVTGELIESMAKALKSSKTGRYYEPDACQFLSAGADGRFGTEDDLTSFERPKP